jgi:hypothetical protein
MATQQVRNEEGREREEGREGGKEGGGGYLEHGPLSLLMCMFSLLPLFSPIPLFNLPFFPFLDSLPKRLRAAERDSDVRKGERLMPF